MGRDRFLNYFIQCWLICMVTFDTGMSQLPTINLPNRPKTEKSATPLRTDRLFFNVVPGNYLIKIVPINVYDEQGYSLAIFSKNVFYLFLLLTLQLATNEP